MARKHNRSKVHIYIHNVSIVKTYSLLALIVTKVKVKFYAKIIHYLTFK
jgi:hypothetical protein